MKKIIALLEGGFSSEAEVSYKSADTVYNNIDKGHYEVYRIKILPEGWYHESESRKISIDKTDFSLFLDGKKIKFECALIMIHGTPGEDGKLQAYFDMIGLPYTTCSHVTSTITFNKYFCNKVLANLGYQTASSVLLRDNMDLTPKEIEAKVGLPCFIKPNDGGSSFGASKASTLDEIESGIQQAFEHGKSVIIEEYLRGTEVTNGVIKMNGQPKALAITEIATENEFFDYAAKYKGESDEITPARISEQLTTEIQSLSESIYDQMGLNGIVRIDYMIVENTPYIIEINTIPGQSSASLIPQQAAYAGISLKDLYAQLIEDTLN